MVQIFNGRGRTFAGLWVAGRDRTNIGWGTGQTHKESDCGMWMDDCVMAGWWLCEWVDGWMGNSYWLFECWQLCDYLLCMVAAGWWLCSWERAVAWLVGGCVAG